VPRRLVGDNHRPVTSWKGLRLVGLKLVVQVPTEKLAEKHYAVHKASFYASLLDGSLQAHDGGSCEWGRPARRSSWAAT